MAKTNSFDVMSQVDVNEVRNAVQQALKEIGQRFDFKGSKSDIKLEDQDHLILISDDEFKLKQLIDVLEKKLVKRKVPLKALGYQRVEQAAGGTVRQRVDIQQGIPTEKCKEIVKHIKGMKLKVQSSIQGDTVRVSGRDRDTLQEVIAALKEKDFGVHMTFGNYR
ncbi:MAG TPA: YajQ family cyclic di-GMP-binding protein [Acidobacteriota bacterium]|nr:YajQ family cyclic di-GMP-binding protein [Acidobacteriota bacterium]